MNENTKVEDEKICTADAKADVQESNTVANESNVDTKEYNIDKNDIADNKEAKDEPLENNTSEGKVESGWVTEQNNEWDAQPVDETKNDATKDKCEEGWGAEAAANGADTNAGGWGAETAADDGASAWDAPAVKSDAPADTYSNNEQTYDRPHRERSYDRNSGSRDEGRGYRSRDEGRDYPRKRFDRGDDDQRGGYGQEKRFRSGDRDNDRSYAPRDGGYRGERGVGSRDFEYGSRDREYGYKDYGSRDGGYRSERGGDRRDDGYGSRDRESGSRDGGYGSRDRESGSRDGGYGSRDRESGSRDGGYGSRERDYPSRGEGYAYRDRERDRGFERRDDGYGSRDRDRRTSDSGYERSYTRDERDRNDRSTYDPMADEEQRPSRPRKVIPQDVPPSKALGLFGLSLYATEEDLREFLAEELQDIRDWKITIITDHVTRRSKGFGFVYFQSLEDSIRAKELLTGKAIKGKEVRVDFSVSDVLRPNYR